MQKARIGKEIVVRVRNEIGVLAQISRLVADKGINILAASAWVEGADGIIHLVVEDSLRVGDVLRQRNFKPSEREVVLTEVPHKPGMLRHVTDVLAREGIDIHHLYATATGDSSKCLIVFACANNERAVVLLNQ